MAGKVDVGAGMVRLRTKTSMDDLSEGYKTPKKRPQVPTPTPSSEGQTSCPPSSAGQLFGKHYFKIAFVWQTLLQDCIHFQSKILQHSLEDFYLYSKYFVHLYFPALRLSRSFSALSVTCRECS